MFDLTTVNSENLQVLDKFNEIIIIIYDENHTRDTNFTIQISNLYNYILYTLIDSQELVKNLQYFYVVSYLHCLIQIQLK